MDSALNLLAALERWIRYTQVELQSLRSDLIQQRQEEISVRQLQQAQLDSLQCQVRDIQKEACETQQNLSEPQMNFQVSRNTVQNLMEIHGGLFSTIFHFKSRTAATNAIGITTLKQCA